MNVKDIIKTVCGFIGHDEIASKIEQSEPSFTQSEQKITKNLLKCLNLVQNEIASQYIPLCTVEEVKAKDFKVEYSSFSKKPIAIISVRDKYNRLVHFKPFCDYLMIYASKANVKYNFLPDQITSLDEEMSQPLVPIHIYAYGVAREYFLQQALSDDADIFEKRFKDSLEVFARRKSNAILPKRRWL